MGVWYERISLQDKVLRMVIQPSPNESWQNTLSTACLIWPSCQTRAIFKASNAMIAGNGRVQKLICLSCGYIFFLIYIFFLFSFFFCFILLLHLMWVVYTRSKCRSNLKYYFVILTSCYQNILFGTNVKPCGLILVQ